MNKAQNDVKKMTEIHPFTEDYTNKINQNKISQDTNTRGTHQHLSSMDTVLVWRMIIEVRDMPQCGQT